MGRISLENVRFRAYHGLYEEERLIGNDFILDVWIDADIKEATVVTEHDVDKVDKTVNYERKVIWKTNSKTITTLIVWAEGHGQVMLTSIK